MIRLLSIISIGFCYVSSHAQLAETPKYYTGGAVSVKDGSGFLNYPFLGGLNSPQFQSLDINNDGTNDLVVYDKNDGRFLTFIRKNASTFQYAPKYETCMPRSFFYFKTGDLNSDGKMDVFTLDETRNLIIYKNITQSSDSFVKFQDLGAQVYRNQYDTAFPILFNPFSLASTDLPEISDIDFDGDLDILAYDATYTIYTLYKDVRIEKSWNNDTFEFQKWDVCFGYFNDFNNTINLGSCPYKQKLKLRHVGGSACFMFDADEDGDKEMVLSNIGQKHMTFLTNGIIEFGTFYDTMIAWDSIFPHNTTRATSYDFPAGFLFDVDGDGVEDLITSPNGFVDVKEMNQVWYYRNFGKTNKPDFRFNRDNFIQEKGIDLGAQSAPAFCDVDADGDMDLFVASNGDFTITAGIKDRVAYYQNTGTKSKPQYELVSSDYLSLSTQKISDMVIRFGDVDGDKDMDLLAGTRLGHIRWYKNTAGVGSAASFTLEDTNLLNSTFNVEQTNAAPLVFNYNNDTLPDLLVGYYNGTVGLFVNKGSIGNPDYDRVPGHAWGMRANEWLTNVSVPGFVSYGYAVPELVDIDSDGVEEILLGTSYGSPRLYRVSGHSVYDSLIADSNWLWKRGFLDSIHPDFGSRITPACADIDGDSVPEIIFGCSRGGLEMATSTGSSLGLWDFNTSSALPFDIYPNPADDKITIRRENSGSVWNITIRDISGREIRNQTMSRSEFSTEISLDGLAAGMYYAEVSNGSSRGVAKFIVQRSGSPR